MRVASNTIKIDVPDRGAEAIKGSCQRVGVLLIGVDHLAGARTTLRNIARPRAFNDLGLITLGGQSLGARALECA